MRARTKKAPPVSADPRPPAGLKLEFGEEAIRKALTSPVHIDCCTSLAGLVDSFRQQTKIWICLDHKTLADAEIGIHNPINRTA